MLYMLVEDKGLLFGLVAFGDHLGIPCEAHQGNQYNQGYSFHGVILFLSLFNAQNYASIVPKKKHQAAT
jgi:hypothetical protein